jgi:hypothetical protein
MTIDDLVRLYESPDSVPPQPALSELGSVDWAAVSDAYGPAIRVPAVLRALCSTIPEHRDIALSVLLQYIWHQGTVYSATAAAVPFLYRLLESDGPQDKSAVAFILATIADGTPPFARCENDPPEAEKWREILRKCDRSLEAEMEQGRQYGAEIRRRLQAELDLLYPYLRDPIPDVRRAVAIALDQFPDVVTRVLPDLRAALEEEPDQYVRSILEDILNRRSPS